MSTKALEYINTNKGENWFHFEGRSTKALEYINTNKGENWFHFEGRSTLFSPYRGS